MNIDKIIAEDLNHGDYKFLIEKFSKPVIENRYKTIFEFIESYIEANELQEKVSISLDLLNNVVIDYFTDIYRLKDFQNIDLTNMAKIYSYTAYWLLRRKVIQIKAEGANQDLSFVNEEMVATYIFSFLLDTNVYIVDSKEKDFKEFQKNLLYSFIFRSYSPQSIESLIYSFRAGMAYQYSIDFNESIK